MSRRMMVASAVVVLCVAHDAAAGQSPSGPVARQPATVTSYDKVLTGLMGNGSDDRLWNSLTPEARRELVETVKQLQQDITVQTPVGPVAPKPPVQPPPKPKPGPAPSPTLVDFEKSLAALKDTLQKATKADPGYVLTAPVDTNMQQLVEKLSNAKRD